MTLTIAIILSLSVGTTLGFLLAGLMFAAKRGDEMAGLVWSSASVDGMETCQECGVVLMPDRFSTHHAGCRRVG